MRFFRKWLLFTLIYLALTSNFELRNLVVGGLVAAAVAFLVRPPLQAMSPRQYPSSILATIHYTLILLLDLIRSGIQMARLVLTWPLPLKPGIINIESKCETDLGAALSAHAITLTPGELVVELDSNQNMYTHVLDATQAQTYVHDAQKKRFELLDQIFP